MALLRKIANGLVEFLRYIYRAICDELEKHENQKAVEQAEQAHIQQIQQNRANYQAYAVWLQNWLRNRADNFDLETPSNPIELMTINIYLAEIVKDFTFSVRDKHIIGNNLMRVDALRDYITQDLQREFLHCGVTEVNVTRLSHGVEIQFINPAILPCDYLCFDCNLRQIIVNDCQNQFKFKISERQPFFVLQNGKWKKMAFVFCVYIGRDMQYYETMRIAMLNYEKPIVANQTLDIGRYHVMQADGR